MQDKKIYLTEEGLLELRKEYEELTKKKRPAVVDAMAQARNQGDLAENAEYHAAKEDLSFIDGRIDELEELLKQVEIIKEKNSSTGGKKVVSLGTKVTLEVSGKKHVYTVVGEFEADPEAQKISNASPLGQALLGKAIGEKVEVEAPAGKVVYTVVSIE